MEFFKDITRLQYTIGVIDGRHIPLFEKLDKKVIALTIDFYDRKKFYTIVLHGGM
jgi:hypothetical protein